MGSIFGGKKSKQSSSNQAYPFIQDSFGGIASNTGNVYNTLSALLGLGGDTNAANAAFENYKDSTGYQTAFKQGQDAITTSAAARGLLKSGSTAKALTEYGQNFAEQRFGDYLKNLFTLANQGYTAGGLISGSGGISSGSGGGGKSGLGALASAIAASDRRLKKDIKYIKTLDNGLRVYQYKYINDRGPYIGVMADEVERIMPEALGPIISGYKTVDYSKIGDIR